MPEQKASLLIALADVVVIKTSIPPVTSLRYMGRVEVGVLCANIFIQFSAPSNASIRRAFCIRFVVDLPPNEQPPSRQLDLIMHHAWFAMREQLCIAM